MALLIQHLPFAKDYTKDLFHLWVILRDSGTCVYEAQLGVKVPQIDPDLGSALFIALLHMSQEVSQSTIQSVQFEDDRLLFAVSEHLVMVLHVGKHAHLPRCKTLLQELEKGFYKQFEGVLKNGWSGNVSLFESFGDTIARLTQGELEAREHVESLAIRRQLWRATSPFSPRRRLARVA